MCVEANKLGDGGGDARLLQQGLTGAGGGGGGCTLGPLGNGREYQRDAEAKRGWTTAAEMGGGGSRLA